VQIFGSRDGDDNDFILDQTFFGVRRVGKLKGLGNWEIRFWATVKVKVLVFVGTKMEEEEISRRDRKT
jgi:hypothetical protein